MCVPVSEATWMGTYIHPEKASLFVAASLYTQFHLATPQLRSVFTGRCSLVST